MSGTDRRNSALKSDNRHANPVYTATLV